MNDMFRIKELAIDRYHGERLGNNGPVHWDRTWENAKHLIPITEANPTVVQLFCYLHDCCSVYEGQEQEHGPAAAFFIKQNRKLFSFLTAQEFKLLVDACDGHTSHQLSTSPTIGTCWDADRLDLGRFGIYPKAEFFSTQAAKDPLIIERAYQNSIA
ncbi:MAG: hypothetical protein ACJAU1_000565 [Psychromonas sp.]|jgi:uncharacterized protein